MNWRYPTPDRESAALVLGAVARAFGFSRAQIQARDRHERLAWARQVAVALLMELTPCTTARASQLIGRDHSTVHYARHRVADLIATDRHLAAEIQRLKAKIQAKLYGRRNYLPKMP